MTPHRLLIALSLALSCCYPHRGERPNADPGVTLDRALEACARQDQIGARHLFTRLAERHPDHPESHRASSQDPCAPHTKSTP